MLKSLFESSIDKLNIPADMKSAIKKINNICLEAEGDETSKNVEKAIGNVGSNTGMFNQHMSAEEAKARYDAQQKEKAAKEGQNDAKSQTQVAKADEKKEESAHKNSEVNVSNNTAPLQDNDLGYTPLGEEDKKKAEQLNAEQERKEKEEKEKQQDDNVPTTIDSAKSDDDIWKVLNNLQKKAVKNRGTAEGEKWRQKLEDEYQKATSTRNFKRVKGLEMTIYNKSNPQAPTAEGKPKEENTDVNNAKSNDEAYEILKNLQDKAVKNRGTEDGEKWRKKLEEEYDKAVRNGQTQRVKGFEMTIYNKGNQQTQTTEGKPEQSNNQNTEQQKTQAATSGEQQNQPKANGEQTAQSSANAEQQTQAAESSEQQAQQKVNGEQQTQTAESNEQQAQNNAKPAATNFKKGADVATVQFFLKATKPQTNLVCDGILGPKTITAIQQTTDIIPSGKMDQKTQEEFNRLLAEAKQKVIPIQKQLGVTADGLIGKQTLGAMRKANMDVASVFNKKPTAPQTQVANNQGGNNANGAANQGNINLLDRKFDESKAQQQLKNKYISQKQYNIWKAFGIAPIYQREHPKETQNQIAQILKETKKQQGGQQQGGQQQASQQKGVQQKAGQQNALKEDVAVKNPDKTSQKGTKENPNTEYVSGTVSLMNMPKDEKKVYDEEYQKSLKANLKPGKNEQIAMDTADLDAKTAVLRYRKNKGRPTQQQSAQQKAGQQTGKQNVQQQPQQVAKQGNVQPAQQGGQSNAKNNDYYSKTTQNGVTTTVSGGTVSYINLPPDEKKVYDDAEKKAIENYIKNGNSERTARSKANMNANAAVIRYRQRKAKKTS